MTVVMLQNEGWGSTVCGAMNSFRQNGEFCNVTLLSNDNRSFVAHDCVLAAASPYLKSLLTDMDLPSCMLKLETISGELIEYILQFIYSGMVYLPLTKLASIATASEQLGVDQLKTLCDGFLKDFDVDETKQAEEAADLAAEKVPDSVDSADVVDFTASENQEGVVNEENTLEDVVTVKYEQTEKSVELAHDELADQDESVDATDVNAATDTDVAEDEKDSKDDVSLVQEDTACIPTMQLEIAGTTVDAETVARQILELPPEAKEIMDGTVVVQPGEGGAGDGASEQVIYVQPVGGVDLGEQGGSKNDVMEGVAILQQLEDGSSGFIMTGNSGIIHVTLSQQPDGVNDTTLQALTVNEALVPTEPRKQPGGGGGLLAVTTPVRPFACFRCNKTFTRRGHLTEHERVHTGDMYRCDVCAKTFQWKRGLELHARVHSGEKPYACDFCGKQFAHASNLMVHRKRHSGEKPYACPMCSMTFCSQSSLIRHRKRHSGIKAHKCEHCGKEFFERNVLKRHMRKHTGEKPYVCGVCGDRFTDVTGLSYHRWTHRKDRPLKCPTCGFGCISQSQLTSHMRTHTGERPFRCETCGKGFKIRANLTAHTRIHSGEKPFECCICSRKFVTSSQLNKHSATHVKQEEDDQSSAEQKPYQCSVCGKRFGRRNNMLQHERLHLGLKPFKCSACEWSFTRRTHLQKHQQKMQHGSPDDLLLERERKAKVECTFACDYCSSCFEDENILLQHQIVCKGDDDAEPIIDGDAATLSDEEGERKFRCNVCKRTFKRNTHLKQHKKSHKRIAFFFSPEGRPYECDVCKKRFKRKNTLNQHKLTHRDDQERRHLLCYLCGRGFLRTTHLKNHVRTMHKDVQIPDELRIKTDDEDDDDEGDMYE